MNKWHIFNIFGLLLVFALCGCVSEKPTNITESPTPIPVIKATDSIPLPTPSPEPHPMATSLPLLIGNGSSSVLLDPAYFDGTVVITQYYTLMDHGFGDESLTLFSKSLYKLVQGTPDYNIQSIKINTIEPYPITELKNKWPPKTIPENELRFHVRYTVIYKGAAWNKGGTPTPYQKQDFISLIKENGEWKIDGINSSPWYPSK
jgi:hypothetical protein